MGSLIELTAKDFDTTLEGNPVVVVGFEKPWCGLCQNFRKQNLPKVVNEFEEKVLFAMVDVECDENRWGDNTASQMFQKAEYKGGTPHVAVFRNSELLGTALDGHVGQIKALIARALAA